MNNIKIKLKTSELTGAALDWAVAKAKRIELSHGCYNRLLVDGRMSAGQKMLAPYNPSTDWEQGGPIIEREVAKIERFSDALWEATAYTKDAQDIVQSGPTPLIAAMRCYVASKLGDEVEVPDELKEVMA
jgi:hypothetical protein